MLSQEKSKGFIGRARTLARKHIFIWAGLRSGAALGQCRGWLPQGAEGEAPGAGIPT